MTTSEARQGLIDLTTLARRELADLWAAVRDMPPGDVRDALLAALPVLGEEYALAAGALAADWYDDMRERSEVRGRFVAEPTDIPEGARWAALVRWGIGPLFREDDPEAALSLIDGGFQRTIADQHRLTVVDNTKRDPQAKGWRRVGVGESCGFCRMLISRGAVYTQSGALFKSHDHCNCFAAPAFTMTGAVSPIAYEQSKARPRSDSARKKRNQRVYDYIREHYGADAL